MLLCLTDLHLLLLYRHFGMEHLKFLKFNSIKLEGSKNNTYILRRVRRIVKSDY